MFSAQLNSSKAVLRFDVVGGPERSRIVEDASFMNYRLGDVKDIDVHLTQFGGYAGNDSGCIQTCHRDQRFRHLNVPSGT